MVNIQVKCDTALGLPYEGEGSGITLSANGDILTNAHVVGKYCQKFWVTLNDGSRYGAKLIGKSLSHDVALLSIAATKGDRRLTPISIRDSASVREGESVYALGSPYGLRNSFTSGVVSSVYRRLANSPSDRRLLNNFIQTDVAINPGNSGGALVDGQARLIGVNTAGVSASGGNDGVNFAIQLTSPCGWPGDLRRYGRFKPPFLGVKIADALTPTLARRLHLTVSKGLLIKSVRRGSPADLAGLKGGRDTVKIGDRRILTGGDVIVSLNGRPVDNASRFMEAIEACHPGDTITLNTLRNGKPLQARIKLSDRPRNPDR